MKPLASLALLTSLLPGAAAAVPDPAALPRSTPEAQGIASAAIHRFVEAADREIDGMHSFMLVRHGHVVAEGWWAPYAASAPHTFYSLTKSFTSTAIGFAVAEGRLTLDDPVRSFFPEAAPAEPSAHLRGMRVRDLLIMSTGHHADAIDGFFGPGPRDLPHRFLELPVAHKPGTHFVYNTPASHLLSEILQRVTGEKLADYLRPRLLEPLGIRDLRWGETADGVTLGGYGIAARTEDIARFGLFYLQAGEWQGRQLLPADWIHTATARQTSNGSSPDSDWEQGYGFQFWRCRHGLYRGDGAFGQYCIVMPEQQAVVAITSGVRDMQAVMNLVWEHLLPALQAEPLAPDETATAALRGKLAGLVMASPAGARDSSAASRVSGNTYTLPAHPAGLESLTLRFAADGATLVAVKDGREHRLTCGYQEWSPGRTGLFPHLSHDPARYPEQPVAAAGAWTADDTFTIKLCLTETPFYVTWQLRFAGDELIFDAEQNVAFGPTRQPQLVGRVRETSP